MNVYDSCTLNGLLFRCMHVDDVQPDGSHNSGIAVEWQRDDGSGGLDFGMIQSIVQTSAYRGAELTMLLKVQWFRNVISGTICICWKVYILLSAYTSLRKYIYISIIHIAEDSKYGLPLVEVDSSSPMYIPLCDVHLQNIMFFPELPDDLTLEQVPSIPSNIHEAPEGSRFYAIRKVCVYKYFPGGVYVLPRKGI